MLVSTISSRAGSRSPSSFRLRSLPVLPWNGRPVRSSSTPGPSPINITPLCRSPSDLTHIVVIPFARAVASAFDRTMNAGDAREPAHEPGDARERTGQSIVVGHVLDPQKHNPAAHDDRQPFSGHRPQVPAHGHCTRLGLGASSPSSITANTSVYIAVVASAYRSPSSTYRMNCACLSIGTMT